MNDKAYKRGECNAVVGEKGDAAITMPMHKLSKVFIVSVKWFFFPKSGKIIQMEENLTNPTEVCTQINFKKDKWTKNQHYY